MGALPDNHVTVLRPKSGSIDPVYLSVYLNSLAGQYQVNNWLRDLAERPRHLSGADSIADLLLALTYKLALPPVDPAADDTEKAGYFTVPRAADSGDMTPLGEIWLRRLEI